MQVYIIMSREHGAVAAAASAESAEKLVKDQEWLEQMEGGHPSVWIKSLRVIE